MAVIEHTPPLPADLSDTEKLAFLNGPIQGAPDWQKTAIGLFQAEWPDKDILHIANPRRELPEVTGEFSDDQYSEQVAWEDTHRQRATKFGGLLYWFAARDHSIQYKEGRAYAKTTMKELSQTFGELTRGANLNVSVGFDPDFEDGLRFERFHLRKHNIPIYNNLDDTAGALIEQIRKNDG